MGCMNIVIFLLQHGANANAPTMRGEAPLHLAARANQTDIVRILLRNNAQVDARARVKQKKKKIFMACRKFVSNFSFKKMMNRSSKLRCTLRQGWATWTLSCYYSSTAPTWTPSPKTCTRRCTLRQRRARMKWRPSCWSTAPTTRRPPSAASHLCTWPPSTATLKWPVYSSRRMLRSTPRARYTQYSSGRQKIFSLHRSWWILNSLFIICPLWYCQ